MRTSWRLTLLIWIACGGVLQAEMRDSLSSVHRRNPYPYVESLSEFVAHPSHEQLIILDPGHGGEDKGTKLQSFYEKKLTLTTALLTKRHLEEMGYRVVLTRSRDIFLSLPERTHMANQLGAALFVSIHYNSSPNPDAKGIEIFYYDSKQGERKRASRLLADCILGHVLDQTGAHSRGVKRGNFLVIRETLMPAVLVEGGFLTNCEECQMLKKKQYLDQVARGIALGVEKFLKQ